MLLDTDIVIDLVRNHPPAWSWFLSLTEYPTLSGFMCMEVIRGCRDKAEHRRAWAVLSPFPVSWATEAECHRALHHILPLHFTCGIGLIDSLLASMAIERGVPLITFNAKHFRNVPSLKIQQPYVR
ncbi:MAG: PIN domain-containing protein [Armatimonadetes bacterium]|nr:PIN domain-containing protein [Armatimonadota bacterium]